MLFTIAEPPPASLLTASALEKYLSPTPAPSAPAPNAYTSSPVVASLRPATAPNLMRAVAKIAILIFYYFRRRRGKMLAPRVISLREGEHVQKAHTRHDGIAAMPDAPSYISSPPPDEMVIINKIEK